MDGEKQNLIERGGERKYVPDAELAAALKDGWIFLGVLIPAPAEVSQRHVRASTPKPQGGAGKGPEAPKEGDQGQG